MEYTEWAKDVLNVETAFVRYPYRRRKHRTARGFLLFAFILAAAVSGYLAARSAMTGVPVEPPPVLAADSPHTAAEEEPQVPPEMPWSLILINAANPIPEGYAPELRDVGGGHKFDARAADELARMLDDARAEGLSPVICSAYRTEDYQMQLFKNKVSRLQNQGMSYNAAFEEAKSVVAYPGTSEHNAGLAVDIVAASYQILDSAQAKTKEGIWLRENCHKYGFILRYLEDKRPITGVIFEPWHFRYVGIDAAEEIMSSGVCLEEYLSSAGYTQS